MQVVRSHLAALIAAAAALPCLAGRAAPPPGRVLILYHPERPPISREVGAARMIGNLVGHFGLTAEIRPAASYRRGTGDGYRAVFYVQLEPRAVPPPEAARELPLLGAPVCWLGGGLDCVDAPALGLRPLGFQARSPFRHVRYHGVLLSRGETQFFPFEISNPSRAELQAAAVSSAGEGPYAARSGHFWYFADSGLLGAGEEDRALAFADLLHDILGIRHAPSRTALVRIEDVSVDSSPRQLRAIADLLASRRVPFAVSLIPVYRNPRKERTVPLTGRPDFVAAIRYMEARGGSIVMHGGTHQYHGVSADDAEFFDMDAQQPLPDDNPAYVRHKLRLGLRTLLAAGIPPVAWETPHYVASQRDYAVFARVFGTCVEQKLVCDDMDYGQAFPFPIDRDLWGQRVIPENLGYVPRDHPEQASQIVRFAGMHRVVRDGAIGFFFHPFLPIGQLRTLIDGVLAQGYTFLDLRRMPHEVHMDDMAIRTGKGTVQVRLKGELLHEYFVDERGEKQRESWGSRWTTGLVTRSVDCPPGWTYVAEGTQTGPDVRTRLPGPAAPRSWWEAAWRRLTRRGPERSHPDRARPAAGAIVWNASASGAEMRDQQSYSHAFAALGAPLERISPGDVGPRVGKGGANLLVVPGAAARDLDAAGTKTLLDFAHGGGEVVTEGVSPLAAALGVRFGSRRVTVQEAQQLSRPDVGIRWQRPAAAPEMLLPAHGRVLTRDRVTHQPLAIAAPCGSGAYVILALPFDDASGLGIARFPYLTRDALRQAELTLPLRSPGLHAFFDPDLRRGLDPERLAEIWRERGISAIHAAGWKRDRSGRSYDYDALIESCHRRGIGVYAWIELPMADAAFYHRHPEWRELTAGGGTAYHRDPSAWRYLMAMEDPACEAALLEWTRTLLRSHAWDGVDLAELYFESDLANDPGGLTPMHPSACRRFAAAAGFDPRALVDPRSPYFWRANPRAWRQFEDWRVEEVSRFHADALSAIEEVRRERRQPLDVVVTVHDSLGVPTIRRDTGIDTPRIVALLKQHEFSLQIEDPAVLWSTDPRRYAAIGQRYRRMLTPSQAERFMLDINVLDLKEDRSGGKTVFPTLRQTGAELDELLAAAGSVAPRVTVYAESSVRPDDWSCAASALASSSGTVTARGDTCAAVLRRAAQVQCASSYRAVRLDGQYWPTEGAAGVVLPPGAHRIQPAEAAPTHWQPALALTHTTIPVSALWCAPDEMHVSYVSSSPGSLSVSRGPYRALLDGKQPLPLSAGEEETSILCPPGRHTIVIQDEEGWHWRLNALSFYGGSAISAAALISIALLTLLYGTVRAARRREAHEEL